MSLPFAPLSAHNIGSVPFGIAAAYSDYFEPTQVQEPIVQPYMKTTHQAASWYPTLVSNIEHNELFSTL